MVFDFSFVNGVLSHRLTDLCMVNHPCDPVMNPTWSWYLICCAVGFGLLIFC